MRLETQRLFIKIGLMLIREFQPDIGYGQRKDLWNEITKGYCPYCGSITNDLPCHCENDD